MTDVVITGLGMTYPGAPKPALADLSLYIPSGSMTALLGPSGCGKTTALKLIAGLLPPGSGDMMFDGRSILTEGPDRHGAVMVFQAPLLFPHMSVAENIGFGLRMRKRPKTEIAARVAEMLDRVKLGDLGARRPVALSGGQQQRVALARALILQPRVLLLDEPLSNLDATLRTEMRDLIQTLQRDMKITTIMVTHDQQEAVAMADQVALILDGRLCQSGPPEAFYKRPATETVARFFGGQNFFPGRSDAGYFRSGLGCLALPDGLPNRPGMLNFRPENVQLGAAAENTLTARLVHRQYLGTQTQLTFKIDADTVIAVVNPDQAASLIIGGDMPITIPRAALWVLP